MNFPDKEQRIKTVQKFLNVGIDGKAGNKTWQAIGSFLGLAVDDLQWKEIIPIVQKKLKIKDDGIDGEKTWSAILDSLSIKQQPKPTSENKKTIWPKQNYSELVKFYGEVGTNQTTLVLPYKMKLAWDLDTEISKITCNIKVKDSLERIFKKTLEHYGLQKIKELRLDVFGGCLNVRKMRGGSAWSMHSWGIAIDLDPDNNQLKWGKDKATFAKPEYDAFWKIVEDEGWTSLGRAKNMDYQHFQAAGF